MRLRSLALSRLGLGSRAALAFRHAARLGATLRSLGVGHGSLHAYTAVTQPYIKYHGPWCVSCVSVAYPLPFTVWVSDMGPVRGAAGADGGAVSRAPRRGGPARVCAGDD